MGDILKLIWLTVIGLFRSKVSLEAEILTLRHQLNVLRRKSPKRLTFSNFDRLVFASLYRIAPRIVNALVIVEPETVIRWHRAGFRLFWRRTSRSRGGRPKVALEIRQLIRDISDQECFCVLVVELIRILCSIVTPSAALMATEPRVSVDFSLDLRADLNSSIKIDDISGGIADKSSCLSSRHFAKSHL